MQRNQSHRLWHLRRLIIVEYSATEADADADADAEADAAADAHVAAVTAYRVTQTHAQWSARLKKAYAFSTNGIQCIEYCFNFVC